MWMPLIIFDEPDQLTSAIGEALSSLKFGVKNDLQQQVSEFACKFLIIAFVYGFQNFIASSMSIGL